MSTATSTYGAGDAGLPDWHELVAAFRGWEASSEHPIARCACGLARLHRKRCAGGRRELVADRRAALIAAIDTWAAEHVRRTERAGESLGAYVDAMAAAAATAASALRTCAPSGDAVHGAWCQLAALANGWADITLGAAAPYTRTFQDIP